MGYLDQQFMDQLQNEYLINSYRSQFISGLSFGYVYNNQRRNLGGNATVLRFNFETAGNLIDGLEHLFSKPVAGEDYYQIFGLRYSQYFRADLSISHKVMLGEVSALVGRLYGGYGMAYGNSVSIPFDRLFYAGGANSMRGWAPRTLGPGSAPEVTNAAYPSQLGDMKLEANLEFRFPIWGMFHGAAFVDVGNIWYADRKTAGSPDEVFHFDTFYKQLGFSSTTPMRLSDSGGSRNSAGRIQPSTSVWVIPSSRAGHLAPMLSARRDLTPDRCVFLCFFPGVFMDEMNAVRSMMTVARHEI